MRCPGRDMFFPTKFVANWKLIESQRKRQLENGVARENKRRIDHQYSPGDLVMIRHDMDGQPRGKMTNPTSGPFKVLKVKGSSIEIDRGSFNEIVNIRRLQPYHTRA